MESGVLSQIVLPACLFVIMLGLGLSLTLNDFTRVATYPKAVLLGLVGQLILLPICGYFIAVTLFDDPVLAFGLMLLAACPGGITSNLVAYLARADIALSVSLTAISALCALITIPLIVGFSFNQFPIGGTDYQLPVAHMMATLVALTLTPVTIGLFINTKMPQLAAKWEPRINTFSSWFLVILIVALVIKQRDTIVETALLAGPATLLLNVTTMLIGFLLARGFRLNSQQSTTICIEVGVQNSALAILLSTTLFANEQMAIPAATYSIMMYLTGGIVIALRRKTAPEAFKTEAVNRPRNDATSLQ